MDCFSVDSCRSLLDIGSPDDLKDLWESDLDPVSLEKKNIVLVKTNSDIFYFLIFFDESDFLNNYISLSLEIKIIFLSLLASWKPVLIIYSIFF